MLSVSVIIPAINEEANVVAAVESARMASADEVIVVDGGSCDETRCRAIAAGARVVMSSTGRAVQQNEGARCAKGDVLLFLHADCQLGNQCIEQIRQAFTDLSKAYGGFRQSIEEQGMIFRILERGNAARVKWQSLVFGDQGFFVRRDLFEKVGGFEDVRLMEDVILSQSLRRHGKLVLLPGPIIVGSRRWKQHGVVRQTVRNWVLMFAWRCGVPPNRLADYYRRHDR